ncbi:MAG: potassium channel protein [Tissierellia bacterium]|nr:potassium channel protein [Tissierellia bacterium]
MDNKKKIRTIATLFILLILVGAIGYSLLLKVSLVDSLYMTIITISTVGYKEVALMNPAAKIFSIIIIFWGVGVVGYTFTTLVVMFVEGKIHDMWRGKMTDNKISKMKDHYILCGYGRTGEIIVEEFIKKNIEFVVIEEDMDLYYELLEKGVLVLHGNSNEEDMLKAAKVESAKGLISAMPNDVENIVTVLTARNLNPDLYIISKAIDKTAPKKLIKAGADNTLSTTEIGGKRMAALMLRPNIISFLDVITHVGDMELDLENVFINENSTLDGVQLKDADIPQKTGLIVFAIKAKDSGEMLVNPSSNYQFRNGDCLIVLGTEEQTDKLKMLAGDRS